MSGAVLGAESTVVTQLEPVAALMEMSSDLGDRQYAKKPDNKVISESVKCYEENKSIRNDWGG